MAGGSPDSPPSPPPSASPNKRRKILAPEFSYTDDQSDDGNGPRRPGTPMEEDESGSPVCGICFSEGGKSISGQIDSCDHYFCFVCILEWAKVESRCPMCKQRFTSIRRPPKLGVFDSERIVIVPERDQIYHLSGNATTTRSDPYAETRCIVCHNMADESLLLLCDLCDSAAHTYCVGLGHTVPEGDWFCHDCAVSRAEHEKADGAEPNCETESENVAEECVEPAAADTNFSIFDIVKDADSASLPKRLSRIISPGRGSSVADEETSATKTHKNLGNCWAAESCARTLRHCRDVQSHIKIIRDNWNSLRDGSLRFPSASGKSSAGNRKRHEEGSVSLLLPPNEQTRAQDGRVGFTQREKRDPYDTEKAWKMLEMAKTAQKIRTGNGNHLSKAKSVNSSNSKLLSKIRSSNYLARKQQTGARNPGSIVMKMKQKQILQLHETDRELLKQKQLLDSTRPAVKRKSELLSSSVAFHEYPLHRKAPVRTDSSLTRSSADYSVKHILDKSRTDNRSSHSLNTTGLAGGSGLSQTKTDVASTSSSQPRTGKCVEVKDEKKKDNGKTEIQSLVKLNLKLLTKGKPLGVNTFKEVARISTHTILAACGLEHSKPRTRSFTRPVCNHRDETQQQRWRLSQDVCRECFYAFVSDVVRSVMRERSSCNL